jgi:hypothetical protein
VYLHPQVNELDTQRLETFKGSILKSMGISCRLEHKTIKQNSRLYVITKDASEPNQKIIPFLDPECNCKINDSAV